ncbi:hypothetical protein CRM89_10640 [Nocardia sp. FDAARGOS_372]|uniref:nucleotide-binding protein n=1 Tax=Nocardia TaxID=1817 RepID=UPI000BEFD47F|nr:MULTISPECIES: nucleotide-binding protein [Nocardia]MBF6314103.1 nucleotide-binding protein [Nocardia farcinica]PEH76385.1 hypothetical protein CRM89_10640 [Nocardia sp. FDAARGOS_372]UEX20732.1 nucleotide-binding protein [Nocardia farcinica]
MQSLVPRLFIGSSGESLQIAEYLQMIANDFCEATVWNQGTFGLGRSALQDLTDALTKHDFAALVLAGEDKITTRGTTHPSPRDNIVFELGLFMGALGPERTFIVYAADDRPKLPSDLSGITYAPYRRRADGNWRAALNPVAVLLREAMRDARSRMPAVRIQVDEMTPRSSTESRSEATIDKLIAYAADLTTTYAGGSAGIEKLTTDPDSQDRWVGNLLGMLQDAYATKDPQVYVAWLRPKPQPPRRLSAYRFRNLSDLHKHYFFSWGEGLAGKSWANSTASMHSPSRPHPWWVFREGCDNSTYLCAPVGPASGDGGILAVGSDGHFDVDDLDLRMIELFASLLALTLPNQLDQ